MAEVLVQFDPPVADESGRTYVARICGRLAEDDRWEGWIEFHPQDGRPVLRTPRETEQPDREELEYWATGLTVAYLEGALERAQHPATPDLRPPTVAAEPAFDRPAPGTPPTASGAGPRIRRHAVLDPFEVYAQGENVLREELAALDPGQLRNVISACGLAPGMEEEVRLASPAALVEIVVSGVRDRAN
ncbi:MAG TPA: hypothetical protein VFL93_12310 [Longimicrobiaceae bacterium]|nr:hypothetical protein [Longimicrobiaceae bacterium]